MRRRGNLGKAGAASRRTANRGEPRICQSAPPKDRSARAKLGPGTSEKPEVKEDSGRPGDSLWRSRRVNRPRRLGRFITRRRRMQLRGDPELVFGDTERTRYGETRKRSVGAAERRHLRIASKVRRWQSRKMREEGRPSACVEGAAGSVQAGATRRVTGSSAEAWRFESPRRSIAGSNRRTEFRGNSKWRSPTRPTDAETHYGLRR